MDALIVFRQNIIEFPGFEAFALIGDDKGRKVFMNSVKESMMRVSINIPCQAFHRRKVKIHV
jgi:hypothetical protein